MPSGRETPSADSRRSMAVPYTSPPVLQPGTHARTRSRVAMAERVAALAALRMWAITAEENGSSRLTRNAGAERAGTDLASTCRFEPDPSRRAVAKACTSSSYFIAQSIESDGLRYPLDRAPPGRSTSSLPCGDSCPCSDPHGASASRAHGDAELHQRSCAWLVLELQGPRTRRHSATMPRV